MMLSKHSAWLEKGLEERFPTLPAGLDAAHVGYNFINVLGRVHYGSREQLPKDD
jgi:hypothetical protein